MARVGRLRDREIVTDGDAAVAHLRGLGEVRVGALAVLGFCMGGRNTYLLAGARPGHWKAAGVFYGGNIMKPWGEGPAPFERTQHIACPMIGLFGNEDPNPSPDDVKRIDAELTRFGVPHEFHAYDGAGHDGKVGTDSAADFDRLTRLREFVTGGADSRQELTGSLSLTAIQARHQRLRAEVERAPAELTGVVDDDAGELAQGERGKERAHGAAS